MVESLEERLLASIGQEPNGTPVTDRNIERVKKLSSPEAVRSDIPLSAKHQMLVRNSRKVTEKILSGDLRRLLVLVGPCSIHDTRSAIEYAQNLQVLAQDPVIQRTMYLVMRAYFEKPRTVMTPDMWKGLMNDPDLKGGYDIEKGIRVARTLIREILDLGVPVATEALDPISAQYLDDMITYYAIGARTVESQTHRELASGLSAPVGMKNGTSGDVDVAVAAVVSAAHPGFFTGITYGGVPAQFSSQGNPFAHIIMRGGKPGPNYGPEHVEEALRKIAGQSKKYEIDVPQALVIDGSHANSLNREGKKDPLRQPVVLHDIVQQIVQGQRGIVGFMMESHLKGGNQPIGSNMEYGVSVTDACLGWKETERALRDAAAALDTSGVYKK